jgi:uncharacterized protein (DUF2141 family)
MNINLEVNGNTVTVSGDGSKTGAVISAELRTNGNPGTVVQAVDVTSTGATVGTSFTGVAAGTYSVVIRWTNAQNVVRTETFTDVVVPQMLPVTMVRIALP